MVLTKLSSTLMICDAWAMQINNAKTDGRDSRRGMPLAILLGVLTVVALIPLLILGAAWLSHSASRIRAAEVDALQDVARTISLQVTREFDHFGVQASALVSNPLLAEGEISRFDAVVRSAAAKTGYHFILTTPELHQLINTFAPVGVRPPVTRTPEEIRVVTSSGAPYVTDVRPNRFTGESVFGLRIGSTIGKTDYVLTVLPPRSVFWRLLQDTYLQPEWRATLIDGQSQIVASSFDEAQNSMLNLEELRDRMALLPTGILDGKTVDGVPTLAAFHAVRGSNWKTLVWLPISKLDEQKNSLQRLVAATSGLALLIGLTLAFGFSRAIRRPTSSLVTAAEALGDGKRPSPCVSTMREANVIGRALELAGERIHERERHLRLVMRELSHRTKNLLAIIQAMARQSSQSCSDFASFAQSFNARLGSLAKSQDMLVGTDWEGADLRDLVRHQLAPFVSDLSCLGADGPSLFISPLAVQNLGMAFHELATNAAKYGSLSSQSGRVDIHWNVDETASRVQITWQESGGPEVQHRKRRGFGRTVLEKVVPRALEGKAELTWAKAGLRWRLDIPLRPLVELT